MTMPRQIEAKVGGNWHPVETWTAKELVEGRTDMEWRYVGGVLEMESGFGDWIAMDQSMTVIEARASVGQEHLRIRLRPYDDAGTISESTIGNAEMSAEKLLRDTVQRTKGARAISGLEQWLADAKRCSVPSCRSLASWQQPDKNAPDGMTYLCEDHRVNVVASVKSLVDESTMRMFRESETRANRLSDECGSLRTELDAAYARIGRLTRDVERLERKGGRR